MALRQGGRALARSLMQAKSLPTRGGGGGPVKYAPELDKPMPLWDELWWHDGLYHSQPVLDGTLEPQLQSPVGVWVVILASASSAALHASVAAVHAHLGDRHTAGD
eukprot:gene2410-2714_t